MDSNSMEPNPVHVIQHLKTQLAAKAEEAASNWSGMQILFEQNTQLKKEIEEIKLATAKEASPTAE